MNQLANWHQSAISSQILFSQNRALLQLAKSGAIDSGNTEAALREITEMGARTLGVERCSAWLYNNEKTAIVCVNLYEASPAKHSSGLALQADKFPAYFDYMRQERVLPAHDAHSDPATREFSKAYLTPLGISSMLDAPIRRSGEMVGVICCEQVGPKRQWAIEEEIFAAALADLVARAYEAGDRAAAQAALVESNRMLKIQLEKFERYDKMKDEFLSNISHEMRTPLTAILIAAESLEDHASSSPAAREALAMLMGGALSMNELVEKMLLSSEVASRAGFSAKPVPIAKCIESAFDMVKKTHPQFNCTTKVAPLNILADRYLGNVLFGELFVNAALHARTDARLTVKHEGNTAVVVLEDDGPGVPPDFLERIGKKFERADSSLTYERKGTGLGLYIVGKIVSLFGGAVSYRNGQNRGFCVDIRLPLAPSE